MKYLIELIEKRKEVGKRPWNPQGGTTNYNNRTEYKLVQLNFSGGTEWE